MSPNSFDKVICTLKICKFEYQIKCKCIVLIIENVHRLQSKKIVPAYPCNFEFVISRTGARSTIYILNYVSDNDKYVIRKVCDCVALFFDFKFWLCVTHLKHSLARYRVKLRQMRQFTLVINVKNLKSDSHFRRYLFGTSAEDQKLYRFYLLSICDT